jgi:antitoxin HicB
MISGRSEIITAREVLLRQLAEEIKQKMTQTEIVARMQTSRVQIDRVLNPEKTGVSLDTIQRAASMVGHQLRIEFETFWKGDRFLLMASSSLNHMIISYSLLFLNFSLR